MNFKLIEKIKNKLQFVKEVNTCNNCIFYSEGDCEIHTMFTHELTKFSKCKLHESKENSGIDKVDIPLDKVLKEAAKDWAKPYAKIMNAAINKTINKTINNSINNSIKGLCGDQELYDEDNLPF